MTNFETLMELALWSGGGIILGSGLGSVAAYIYFNRVMATKLKVKQVQMERIEQNLVLFTHIATHDLREPARRAVAWASVAKEATKDISPTAIDALDIVVNNANQMLTQLASFKTFAEIGTRSECLTPISVLDVLNGHIKTIKSTYLREAETSNHPHFCPKWDLSVSTDLSQVYVYEPLFELLIQRLWGLCLVEMPQPFSRIMVTAGLSSLGWQMRWHLNVPPEQQNYLKNRFLFTSASSIQIILCHRIMHCHEGRISTIPKTDGFSIVCDFGVKKDDKPPTGRLS